MLWSRHWRHLRPPLLRLVGLHIPRVVARAARTAQVWTRAESFLEDHPLEPLRQRRCPWRKKATFAFVLLVVTLHSEYRSSEHRRLLSPRASCQRRPRGSTLRIQFHHVRRNMEPDSQTGQSSGCIPFGCNHSRCVMGLCVDLQVATAAQRTGASESGTACRLAPIPPSSEGWIFH